MMEPIWVEPEVADAEGLPCAYCCGVEPEPGERLRSVPHPACDQMVADYLEEQRREELAEKWSPGVAYPPHQAHSFGRALDISKPIPAPNPPWWLWLLLGFLAGIGFMYLAAVA